MLQVFRRRIAIKLTLTLVGFVAVSLLLAGFYLNRALESLASESLEARLVTAGRLLHDETLVLVRGPAPPATVHEFAVRAARLTGLRVTVIALDGRVLGDSEVVLAGLGQIESHEIGRASCRERV